MMRQAVAGSMVAASLLSACAGDFPLVFKTVAPDSVMAFPGSTGGYGQLMSSKPGKLKQEPPRVSTRPLYGELRAMDEAGRLFRIDESKGAGKGYDQLIIDLNSNGDLTDDPVLQPTKTSTSGSSEPMRQVMFGPLTAPVEIAGCKPTYLAHCYIYLPPAGLQGQDIQNHYYGQLMLKAAWYLEAEAQIGEKKVRIGFYDGDSNFRIGDLPQATEYRNSGQPTMWYIGGGDNVLMDADGSGAFNHHQLFVESRPYSQLVYFGATPYRVTAKPDLKSVSVEPWNEDVAEVLIGKNGEQVRNLMLARKCDKDQWQVLCLETEGGKIRVPPGSYRLYACTLTGGSGSGQVLAGGYQREVKEPLEFALGKPNALNCGGPLTLKVTAEKRKPYDWERTVDKGAADSDFILAINGNVVGIAGEIYSGYSKGEKFEDSPPEPRFTVFSGGKQVAQGNLEFG